MLYRLELNISWRVRHHVTVTCQVYLRDSVSLISEFLNSLRNNFTGGFKLTTTTAATTTTIITTVIINICYITVLLLSNLYRRGTLQVVCSVKWVTLICTVSYFICFFVSLSVSPRVID